MSSLSSNDLHLVLVAFIGAGSLVIGLVSWGVVLTIGFRKATEIEKIINPNSSSNLRRSTAIGTNLVGRVIRTVNMATFLFWRRIPGYGVWVASKLGDTQAEVPRHLRAWVTIPFTVFVLSGITFFVCGGLARWIRAGLITG